MPSRYLRPLTHPANTLNDHMVFVLYLNTYLEIYMQKGLL